MRPFLLVVIFSGACGLGYGADPAPVSAVEPAAQPAQTPAVKPPAVNPAPTPVDAAPQMESISAKTAKPGDIVSVAGVGLSSHKVDQVFLTDHKFDMRVKVLEQSDQSIKFRVPPFAKPGRVQLLVQTTGDNPKLLEQPFYIVIEQPGAEAGKAKSPEPAAPNPVQRAAIQQ